MENYTSVNNLVKGNELISNGNDHNSKTNANNVSIMFHYLRQKTSLSYVTIKTIHLASSATTWCNHLNYIPYYFVTGIARISICYVVG